MLPPELAPIVLAQAPDATTLKNLILSAPSFYYGYLASPSTILRSVLVNELGFDTISEALATYYSAPLKRTDVDVWRDNILNSLKPGFQLPSTWSLSDSLALSKINDDVEFFTSRCALDFFKSCIAAESKLPATSSETVHIRRAFYRFELYCNLFPKSEDRPNSVERKEVFLDKFAPWENEQLATIYEYLRETLSIGFDDIAKHDVLWGKHRIGGGKDDSPPWNNFKEHCLSLGLGWLRNLAMATTHHDRYQILIPETGNQEPNHLYKTLESPFDVEKDLIELSELTDSTVFDHIEAPFIEEADQGPFTAWRWAYKDTTASYTYFADALTSLRSQGLFLFDYDRLLKSGLLNSPFQQNAYLQERKEEFFRDVHKLEHSQRKRSEIYDAGGRGYWIEEGNSKLIWDVPYLGNGMEYTLSDTELDAYRDYWKDDILVDRVRMDDYMLRDNC